MAQTPSDSDKPSGIDSLQASAGPERKSRPFEGKAQGVRRISIAGSLGQEFLTPTHPITAEIKAVVNREGPTLTYLQQDFDSTPYSYECNRQFSPGLGLKISITLRIDIDAVSAVQENLGPLSLLPREDGTFAVQQRVFPLSNGPCDRGEYPAEWVFDFTGAYTLTGPTETVKGRFSIRRTIHLHNRNPLWNLDSSDYPQSLALKGRQLMQWISAHAERIVEAKVDGVSVVVYSGGEHWDFNDAVTLVAESSARVEGNSPVVTQPSMDSPPPPKSNHSMVTTSVKGSVNLQADSLLREASDRHGTETRKFTRRSGLAGYVLGHIEETIEQEGVFQSRQQRERRLKTKFAVSVTIAIVLGAAVIGYVIKQWLRQSADGDSSNQRPNVATMPTTSPTTQPHTQSATSP